MRRWAFGAVAVVVAVGVGALLARDGEDPGGAPGSGGPVAETVLGLCDAAEAASRGSLGDARDAFFDRSHDGLHDLARLAGDEDRAATARLLESKRSVESALEGGTAPTALATDLRELAERVREAARAVGADPPPCPDGGG